MHVCHVTTEEHVITGSVLPELRAETLQHLHVLKHQISDLYTNYTFIDTLNYTFIYTLNYNYTFNYTNYI